MPGGNWTVTGPQSIDVDAVTSLKLGLVRGSFTITEHDDPSVRLQFSEVHGDPVAVSLNGGRLEVRHQLHGAQGWFKNLMETVNHNSDNAAAVTVAIPRGVEVEAGTVSGEGLASGISAHVRLNTVSGAVTAEDTSGELQVNTVSGQVSVRNHRGVLTAKSISGEVTASGHFTHVRTNTVSGHLNFNLLGYTQDFGSNSVSGDLTITLPADVGVDIVAKSAGGAVILDGSQCLPTNGKVETIAGPDMQLMLVRTNSLSGKTTIIHAPGPVGAEGDAER
ncbi:DUF4097 family beta strand repeat-containing protein [Pseudarthrobacter niigatensis]|uniref:DUF4097 domain-containing protein n=1 Tax=Pseudarthrobacter niigatensis TaxID=369935 RepID=A0AAJ1SWB5_9MICC|nr:DUF4097 family beta strand repeat-containing protein [Pseudarthrobacter niigatensis]MDQ0145007.1 hypothetical protein [Pseudarthrobacter niigatensis]MDQ0264444.1 hypothetical protein [Pseudarthrobacter niigatensis]